MIKTGGNDNPHLSKYMMVMADQGQESLIKNGSSP